MPESRYVSAGRLMSLVRYLAGAVLVLVLVDAILTGFGVSPSVRRLVALVWLIVFPIGGWIMWRRHGPQTH